MKRLGIIGAGKLGFALARLALAAGYEVTIAGSGSADSIELTASVLAPGARAATATEVAASNDMVVLAITAHRFRSLPADLFDGKILIDATNYWEETDTGDIELATAPEGTSVLIRDHFPAARVVKSLNQLSYHQIDELPRPAGAHDRVAVAAAGDDPAAVRTVMRLIDELGFDPVDAGSLADGRRLEPDGSPYAETYTAAELTDCLALPLER
jgi:predicted dinucleotide-binding enzyme